MAHLIAWVYFNETVLQFVDDLKTLYPSDPKLKLAYATLKIFMASKKQVIQQAFNKSFAAYADQILAHDSDFFMSHTSGEYKQDYKRMKQDGRLCDEINILKGETEVEKKEGMFAKVIDSLKVKWSEMDGHNKDVIWRYMDQLVRLNEVCAKTRVSA